MKKQSRGGKRRLCAIVAGCAIGICVLMAGCAKHADDQEAIRASIDRHLQERADLNMSALDREVKQITINGDQATAQVEFRLKQGGGTMDVDYDLERQNGQWTVLQSAPSGGNLSHPGMDRGGVNQGGVDQGIDQAGPPGSGDPGTVQDKLSQFDDLLKKKGP